MPLPSTFQFSQGRLQDYVDCPRRFQLRYVLMQPWPALIVEPPGKAELHMQRGADFHRLAHQHALGLEADLLAATIHDGELARWWQTYLDRPPPGLPGSLQRSEVTVTTPMAGFPLAAKFDLLSVEPGERIVIVDWKTMHRQPQRTALARRLQTSVYRYLAVKAGAGFNNGLRPQPEQVEMIYWFAHHGGATERFPYDREQYAADQIYLAELIAQIEVQQEAVWPLTANERNCHFCDYRSLCDRGVTAGFLEDLEEDLELPELEIDLELIAEIEF
jgi:CRISPR/Cas system-associated exonuclease Cas4 (RecB family)